AVIAGNKEQYDLILERARVYREETGRMLKAKKQGYTEGNSNQDVNATVPAGSTNWLPVLPAQLDVNIPLVDDTAPQVQEALIQNDAVYLTFSKYMRVESLGISTQQEIERTLEDEAGGRSVVKSWEWQASSAKEASLGKLYSVTDGEGNAIPYTLRYLNAEQAPANINYGEEEAPWYVSKIRLKFDQALEEGEPVLIKLYPNGKSGFVSYAGTQMPAEEVQAGEGGTETVVYTNIDGTEKKEETEKPVFAPAGGKLSASQRVSITCGTKDAVIYYTLDEAAELNTNCPVYDSPITLPEGKTVKVRAFAVKTGLINSKTAEAEFSVESSGGGIEPEKPSEEEDKKEAEASGQGDKFIWILGMTEELTYTGAAIKPEPRVYMVDEGGKEKTLLTLGQDYVLSYKNNVNAAQQSAAKPPTVIVKLKGSYTGSYARTFTIAPKDIADGDVAKNNVSGLANGKSQKLIPVISYNGKNLKNNKDFTITYPSGLVDAGRYALVLTGQGNYKGETEVLEILQDKSVAVNLSKAKAVMTGKVEPFNPGSPAAQTPAFTLTYGGKTLQEGEDYKITYSGNTWPGTAVVTFTAAEGSSFYGIKKATFKIIEAKINISSDQISVSVSEKVPYAKGGAIPEVVVKDLRYTPAKTLTPGVDYSLSLSNHKKVGTAKYAVKGKGKYAGQKAGNYEVGQQDLSRLWFVIDDYISAGEGKDKPKAYQKAKLQIFDLDGKALSAKDYYVEWGNNPDTPKIGDTISATVKAREADASEKAKKGSGFYTGERSIRFRIISKSMSLSSASIGFRTGSGALYSASAKAFVYMGKAVAPDGTNLSVAIKGRSGELEEGKDYEILACLDNGKTGTGKLFLKGLGDYGGVKAVSFKIAARK
ncbi:MAG: chitobiase/beta-hexosaminidase C-terminal domain-containing protein, partial [Lachnospiraceae bacterium]|nr:chitobiase/beta-hexosaminidase C-terminal domain-containing protein [Lachnospiraceae bacterium]